MVNIYMLLPNTGRLQLGNVQETEQGANINHFGNSKLLFLIWCDLG